MMEPDNLIELNNVKKHYLLGKVVVQALRGVTFSLKKGDFVSIIGPSGSGKSTLLHLIGCLDKPSEGTVYIENNDVEKLSEKKLTQFRAKKLGFIFQSFSLIPTLTAAENVEYTLIINKNKDKRDRKKAVEEILDLLNIKDKGKKRINELSGGERQRVAIARALVHKPELVIADEPTANLDSRTGRKIIEEMRELNRKKNITFIFATHDPLILEYIDKKYTLKDGLFTNDVT